MRADKRFIDELAQISQERLQNKLDRNKISSRRLTALIPKHKAWPKVKKDLTNISKLRIKEILKESNHNDK